MQVAKGKKPRQKKAKVAMPPKAKGSFLKKGGGEFTKEELNKSQGSTGSRRDEGSVFSRKQLYDLKQNDPEEYRTV